MPHSDIHGSTPARGSPWLFAACHVFHRLLVPRHPPNALLLLNINHRSRRRIEGFTMYRNQIQISPKTDPIRTRTHYPKLSIHTQYPPGITTEKITATCLNVVADDRWQYPRITTSLYRSDRPRSFSAPKHASEPDLQFIKNTSPPGRNPAGTHVT